MKSGNTATGSRPSSAALGDCGGASASPPAKSQRWRSRRPRTRAIVVVAALILALGPLLWIEAPREIAKWYQAAGLLKHRDGNLSDALTRIDTALSWDPNSDELYRLRAQWKLEANDLEGSLADYQQAVQLASQDPRGYVGRSEVYQRMGRHHKAVRDWDHVVELTRDTVSRLSDRDIVKRLQAGRCMLLDGALNARAYYRARGMIEIEQGLEDVQQAIRLLENGRYRALYSRAGGSLDSTLAMYLDTRGYLYYLQGDWNRALDDLSKSIVLAERALAIEMSRIKEFTFDERVIAAQQQQGNQNLAVIYHHLGLVHQELGNQELAQSSLDHARDLGYNPDTGVW